MDMSKEYSVLVWISLLHKMKYITGTWYKKKDNTSKISLFVVAMGYGTEDSNKPSTVSREMVGAF